tara:strand:+ start:131 stop:343 length:213 start_codon:yes stop_codon:yes gene_type:complete
MIVNETFESYREEANRIHDAMRLLVKYKYKIIDLENQLIDHTNIDRPIERVKGNASYSRVPKHKRVYLNK